MDRATTARIFISGRHIAVRMEETVAACSPPRIPAREMPMMAVLLRKVPCSSTPLRLGSLVAKGAVKQPRAKITTIITRLNSTSRQGIWENFSIL